jgi:uncharacterized protein (UPF0210 family)
LRPAATAAAASCTAEKVAETKEIPEDVAEILEDAGIETGSSGSRSAYTRVSETVIKATLVLVSKDSISFAALFEFLFSIRVVGIAVRMVLERELAIRALYFHVGSRARNAQHLVIVTFAVGCRNKIPSVIGERRSKLRLYRVFDL